MLQGVMTTWLGTLPRAGFGTRPGSRYLAPRWPVSAGDAGSTCPGGLLILLVVMCVHMCLSCLLLQDFPEFIHPDAAKKGGSFVWLLNHPLQRSNRRSLARFCLLSYRLANPRKRSPGWMTRWLGPKLGFCTTTLQQTCTTTKCHLVIPLGYP